MDETNKTVSLSVAEVENRMISLRGQSVLLDRDVAAMYGVETKHVNQAVRNNPGRFPVGYVFALDEDEMNSLRSKILTLDAKGGRGRHSKHGCKAFTERGLYMLATILKSERAERATLAIVEAYAQMRSMVRDMETLQTLKDGSPEQARNLTRAGHKLAALIGENLSTDSTKTTIELNLAVLKITHEVTRSGKGGRQP